MHIQRKLVVGLGLMILSATVVLAQPPFGGGMGMGGNLASNKSVQKELKLTDDQVKQLDEAVKGIREKHGLTDFSKLRDMSMEERNELLKTVREDTQKSVATILSPDQAKRLHQIELQQRGAQAFGDENVKKVLALTDDQQEKIKTIQEDARTEIQEMFQNAQGGDRAEMMKKFAAFRKETNKKVFAVLTPEQNKAWKDLTGAPFEVVQEPFGGRGRKKDDK